MVVVAAVAAGAEAQGAAVVVLAEAATEEEEWGTAVVTVRVTEAALDLATPALGIRGTTLCNAELPFAKHFPQRRKSSRQKPFQPQPLDALFGATSHGSLFEGTPGRAG